MSMAGLVCAVSIGHGIWGWVAARRLQACLTQLRDAGQWTSVSDLVMQPVPDADNAGEDYRAAAASLDSTLVKQYAFFRQGGWPDWPYSPAELDRVRAALPTCQVALDHAQAAATKARLDWKIDPNAGVLDLMLPKLSLFRELANSLDAAALDAHLRGDDAQFCERIAQLFRLARALDEMPVALVSHLVANGCDMMACRSLQQLAQPLSVDSSQGAATQPVHPATRRQLAQLISELLDDTPHKAAWKRAMAGERVLEIELADSIITGKNIGSASAPVNNAFPQHVVFKSYLFGPIVRGDICWMSANVDKAIGARQAPDFPTATQLLGSEHAVTDAHPYLHLVARILAPSFERVLANDYRLLAERRATAALLAIRLFSIDHERRLPSRLDELVPTYLPAVPFDPMAQGGRTLRYLPRPSDPIVYSVGMDGVDDGGSETPLPGRESARRGIWGLKDAVFHYLPQPKPPSGDE